MVYIAKALLVLSFVLFVNSAENGCQTIKTIIDNCGGSNNLMCIAKGLKLMGDDGKVHEDKAYAFFQPHVVNQTFFDDAVQVAKECAEDSDVNYDNPSEDDVRNGLACLFEADEDFEEAFGCKPLVEGLDDIWG